jgi:hypothetical protein
MKFDGLHTWRIPNTHITLNMGSQCLLVVCQISNKVLILRATDGKWTLQGFFFNSSFPCSGSLVKQHFRTEWKQLLYFFAASNLLIGYWTAAWKERVLTFLPGVYDEYRNLSRVLARDVTVLPTAKALLSTVTSLAKTRERLRYSKKAKFSSQVYFYPDWITKTWDTLLCAKQGNFQVRFIFILTRGEKKIFSKQFRILFKPELQFSG